MTDIDPGIHFPGESEEYRRERNRLLDAEVGLRRAIEQVAAQRRALPLGGVVPDDYRFEAASDGGEVRFSELFDSGTDTLVVYSFMFPRYSGERVIHFSQVDLARCRWLAATIRGRTRSCWRGSRTRRRAWTTWSGCAGRTGSAVRGA